METYLNTFITETVSKINNLNINQIDTNVINLIVDYFDSGKVEIPKIMPIFGCVGPRGPNGYYNGVYLCGFCGNKSIREKEHNTHLNICPELQIQCVLCSIPIKRAILDQHQQNCDHRSVSCDYCQSEYKYTKSLDHFEKCPGLFYSQKKKGYYPIGLKTIDNLSI